jgi:hypothetical protein
MSWISERPYSDQKPDPFWRASRICARLHLKKTWSARDHRVAAALSHDPGVENRLIDQALSALSASTKTGL